MDGIEIKRPAVTEVHYCDEPNTKREIEIETMIFDEPLKIGENYFLTAIKCTYTDNGQQHNTMFYQTILTKDQLEEAVTNIKNNPNAFKTNGPSN